MTRTMLTIWAGSLVLAVANGAAFGVGDGQPDAKVEAPEIRKELLRRETGDQEYRTRLTKYFTRSAESQTEEEKKEIRSLIENGQKVDRDNTAWLKGVIDKHGWPGYRLVGKDGEEAAFLFAQHADLDPAFQKRCLELVAAAVKQKDARPAHLAYLTDRVSVKERNRQVYGTQVRVVNGKPEPFPIEDEAGVDVRRKAVGLPPLAEYLKQFGTPTPKKADEKGSGAPASPKKGSGGAG